MPKVSKTHLDSRRAQILEAAYRCFSRKGFQATTTREICREAKLSSGAVYSYFSSKDAIIEGLVEAYGRPQQDLAAAESDDPEMTAPAMLSSGFGRVLNALTTRSAKKTASLDLRIWSEAISNRNLRRLLNEALARIHTPWMRAVRQGQAVGTVNPNLDPSAAAHAMVAMTLGLEVLTIFSDGFEADAAIEASQSLIRGEFALVAAEDASSLDRCRP